MKVFLTIIRYIFIIILTALIILLAFMGIASSTILNKEYVLAKLDETEYYDGIYQEINNNFENYIYQSGFDETVINNIVTKEKIKKDTNVIISNIYDGTNEEIDVTEIKTNLMSNINNYIQSSNLTHAKQDAIDSFIDTICKEYNKVMTHTDYEQSIYNMYVKALKYVETGRQVLLIAILVITVLIFALYLKEIYRGISKLGIAITASGIFCVFTNAFITSKVKIDTIKILNDSFSNALRGILNDIVGTIGNLGCILLLCGMIVIIVGSIIESTKNKEQKVNKNKSKKVTEEI